MQSIVSEYDQFAKRLRRERERLGLTQKEFAEKVGVSRVSQGNYESGKRYPGKDYFEAVKKIGVDDYYLVSGTRMGEDAAFATRIVLWEVLDQLGLEPDSLNDGLEDATQLCQRPGVDRETLFGTIRRYVTQALTASPRIMDVETLALVLEQVDSVAEELRVTLSPMKRARVIAMVFRTCKPSDRIDREAIAEAIELAV